MSELKAELDYQISQIAEGTGLSEEIIAQLWFFSKNFYTKSTKGGRD